MKRFYPKFRISLMTFAIGLANVFMFNSSLQISIEVSVNLPEVQSDAIIFIKPTKKICIEYGGHGVPDTKEFKEELKLNCLKSNEENSK